MADDINKKILIQVEAETDQLKKNVTDLNQTLDGLLQKQKQLTDAGQQNTKAFQDMSVQVKAAQTVIENHSKAIENNVRAIDSSNNTLQKNKELMVSLLQQHDSLSKSEGDHTDKIKTLNTQISTLSNTITDQVTNLTKSREVFDVHKATVNALSSSFDKLKGVSGTFGPSLEEAAKGFEALKSGLSIVQTGFTGVGQAIKTTGFGLLLVALQSLVDYFTKTTEGSKTLKGAISAVGKIVEIVHQAFAGLGKIIVDAVTHPVESFKALGNMIKENIINRFKAFSVILDGIIHLDFKKITNGAVQAFTGVTDATDKIGTAFNTVKKGVEDTANQMVSAYQEGYKKAGQHVDDHEKDVKESLKRQGKYYKDLSEIVDKTYADEDTKNKPVQKGEPLTAVSGGLPQITTDLPDIKLNTEHNDLTKSTENKTVDAKKAALKKVEDFAKQSENKIATEAINVLSDSIKKQSEAKIAALEKDKAAELSNNSLTSAQKLAIEQKYRLQEGKIKAKAFKEEQEASIAQAVINGALAVTKVTAQGGLLAAVEIGIVIAETAAQIAKIATQKPPAYAMGGLHYKSDGRGGVLPGYSTTDNTNAYLRSGEGIVVSEAMQVPWARNLVSAINVGFGGRDFSITNPGRGYAVGGIFTDGGDANRYYNQPVTDQKNLANTIAYQMINNFPPVYVDVKDVNNQQNILAQTINRVNL
jgi:uncharacterized phage infection (PIP) family protein YhgE